MSTPAPRVQHTLVDRTQTTPDLVSGIAFVQGITKRGPINDPKHLIYSWDHFVTLFGGLISTSDFPLHCKEMLDRGVILRVNSIKVNAVNASVDIQNSDSIAPSTLFTLESKYPGEDYNNLSITTSEPTDSELGDFNMEISFNNGEYVETYENVTVGEDEIITTLANSKWVQLQSMGDLSGLSGSDLIPAFSETAFTSGDDGDAELDTALADFSAFDEYEDSIFLSNICDYPADAVILATAGEAYAASRKDLRYYHSIPTSEDSNTIITARKDLPYSRWISYTSGGWVISHPETGEQVAISEVSHFIANGVQTINLEDWWLSFSGPQKTVPGVLKPEVNFGGKAKFQELDMLNRANVNMAINRYGSNIFWGNFSGQRENTHTKFISTNNLIIYMNKSLGPVLEEYIEQPLDIPLFRTIYHSVTPFLDSLVTGRAIFTYDWLGDQDVTNLDELKVNTAVDIQNGIYKVRLPITRINPLQKFNLVIELSPAGVTIE